MIARLLVLFLVLPLVELYLLLRFADFTSIPTTIAVVVLTGVCGSILAARQGAAAMRNFRLAISQRRAPAAEALDGIMIAFAAALLLSPGLLTDSLGIVLLIPWSRKQIRRWLVHRYASRFSVVSLTPGSVNRDGTRDDSVVDATFRRATDEPASPRSLP